VKLLIFLIPLSIIAQRQTLQFKLDSCKTTVYTLYGKKTGISWKDSKKGMYKVRINCEGKIEEVVVYKTEAPK